MNYFQKNMVEITAFDSACTLNGLAFHSFDGMHCRIIGNRTVDVWIGSQNMAWRDQSRGHTKSTPYSINKVLNLALCPLPDNVVDKMAVPNPQQKAKIMPDFARTPKQATNQVNLDNVAAPWATGTPSLKVEDMKGHRVLPSDKDSKDVTIDVLRAKVAEQASAMNQYAIINEQLRGQYAEQQAEIKRLQEHEKRVLSVNSSINFKLNNVNRANERLRERLTQISKIMRTE